MLFSSKIDLFIPTLTIACLLTAVSGSPQSPAVYVEKSLARLGLIGSQILTLGNNYLPIEQEVTFWCTRPDLNDFQQVFVNDVDIANKINPNLPVALLIHGYLDSFRGGFLGVKNSVNWMEYAARGWAVVGTSNVCAVDWSRLANYGYITASTKNAQMAADHVGEIIFFLNKQLNIQLDNISLAGHSLGAQVLFMIGSKFNGQIGAMYGLDPAGPGFANPTGRLNPNSAKYVQCIRTNMGGLGMSGSCGHAEFFVNDGKTQPKCGTSLCSHIKAAMYFVYSIIPANNFVGTVCSNYNEALQTNYKCSNVRDLLGIRNARIQGTFYVPVSDAPPYALGYV